MKIAVIGTGYVGLVTGTCFAETGNEVICVDIDKAKIDKLLNGQITIYEPGLEKLFLRNLKEERLCFTTSLAEGVKDAAIIFLALPTPQGEDGSADLKYVLGVADDLGKILNNYKIIVDKSTVPVGTAEKVRQKIAENYKGEFDVVSNPEFLREGAAIGDFKRPDRVVVGIEDERARPVMTELYRPLNLNETPILFTGRRTSELTKYAANAFLALKITFINEMADLCESLGADVQQVARGIGLDNRIGSKFLHAGPGYGGSCFPKDTLALVRTATDAGSPLRLIETTVEVNDARKKAMADRVAAALGGTDLKGKTVALLGLTFKPNTDDMRDAPSLDVAPALIAKGATVQAFDPEGMAEAAKLLDGVVFRDGPYDAVEGADVVVILTEWDQFRALDLDRVKLLLKQPVMVDLRNVYRPEDMKARGFRYTSIGRPESAR